MQPILSGGLFAALTMLTTAALIIALVRYGMLNGLGQIAAARKWSAKTRGQVTGYATSVPEFVCLVAAGLSGVWDAGLWNIASSNMINGVLMLAAVFYYGQHKELFNRRFFDEIFFALLAVALPLVLMQAGADTHWLLIPVLLGFFAIYRLMDVHLNPAGTDEGGHGEAVGSLPLGLLLTVGALILIGILGIFLGSATREVVEQFGVHPAIAGWLLGTVTSIPEMISFFSVYSRSHKVDKLHQLEDTQEVLDNLTGSNMANTGFVYPLGLLAFLVGGSLL
jgi:Ca2+/Na+ antiporter